MARAWLLLLGALLAPSVTPLTLAGVVPPLAPRPPWALRPGHATEAGGCACTDRRLCLPISAPPPAHESFVFLEADGPGDLGPEGDFLKWDWTAITTVSVCHAEALPPGAMAALTCRAHAAGARVVFAKFVDKGNDLPLLLPAALGNTSARAVWVSAHVAMVQAAGADGINLDLEVPVASGSAMASHITEFASELAAALRTAQPGAQVTLCTPSLAAGDCMYGRCYEYARLAAVLDFLVVMEYSGNGVGRAEGVSPWMSTAALPSLQTGAAFYRALGVEPSSLVMVMPWFGFDYACTSRALPNPDCVDSLVPYGVPAPSYHPGLPLANLSIVQMVENHSSAGGRQFDPTASSAWAKWTLGGVDHTVYYDDAATLRPKFSWARAMGAKGVGVYSATYLNYTNPSQVATMWGALRGH